MTAFEAVVSVTQTMMRVWEMNREDITISDIERSVDRCITLFQFETSAEWHEVRGKSIVEIAKRMGF